MFFFFLLTCMGCYNPKNSQAVTALDPKWGSYDLVNYGLQYRVTCVIFCIFITGTQIVPNQHQSQGWVWGKNPKFQSVGLSPSSSW